MICSSYQKTATGLQTAINCLTIFCQEWGMSINCKKTKVAIFQRYGKTPNYLEFFSEKDKINIVQEYTYLGLTFTRTGSLKMAAKCLAQKATNLSLYSNWTTHFSKVTEPRINIKLYESVIKPIAAYGCAVWGQDFLKSKELFKHRCKTDADKIQEKLCRFIMPKDHNGYSGLCWIRRVPRANLYSSTNY